MFFFIVVNVVRFSRFGASGAVARPKVCANLEVCSPRKRYRTPRLRKAVRTLCAVFCSLSY